MTLNAESYHEDKGIGTGGCRRLEVVAENEGDAEQLALITTMVVQILRATSDMNGEYENVDGTTGVVALAELTGITDAGEKAAFVRQLALSLKEPLDEARSK